MSLTRIGSDVAIGTWNRGVSYTEMFQPSREDQFTNAYPVGFLKEATQIIALGTDRFGLDSNGTELAYQWRSNNIDEPLAGGITFNLPVSSSGLSGFARLGLVINSATNGNRRIQLRDSGGIIQDVSNLPLNGFGTNFECWGYISTECIAIFGTDGTNYMTQISGYLTNTLSNYLNVPFAIESINGNIGYSRSNSGLIATDYTFNYNNFRSITNEALPDPNIGLTNFAVFEDGTNNYFGVVPNLYIGKGSYVVGNIYRRASILNGEIDLSLIPTDNLTGEIYLICISTWPTGEYLFMRVGDEQV